MLVASLLESTILPAGSSCAETLGRFQNQSSLSSSLLPPRASEPEGTSRASTSSGVRAGSGVARANIHFFPSRRQTQRLPRRVHPSLREWSDRRWRASPRLPSRVRASPRNPGKHLRSRCRILDGASPRRSGLRTRSRGPSKAQESERRRRGSHEGEGPAARVMIGNLRARSRRNGSARDSWSPPRARDG